MPLPKLLLPLLLGASAPIDAPVTQATLFGDRAHVVRTAKVKVDGTGSFVFPPLPDGVDPASLRLDATGARVSRIDVRNLDEAPFARDEARELLNALDALDDRIRLAEQERSSAQQVLSMLARSRPTLAPAEHGRPTPKLETKGWLASLQLERAWMEKLQLRIRERNERLELLAEERLPLMQKARNLQARRRHGLEVTAQLTGTAEATLQLRYATTGARWTPAYVLTWRPDRGQLEVALSAWAQQTTGEDWNGAAFTFSTALPALSTALPELSVWRLGEKERFIPTPVPQRPPLPPAPPRPLPPVPVFDEEPLLRAALDQRIAAAPADRGGTGRKWITDFAKDTRDSSSVFAPAAPPPPPMPSPAAMAPRREAKRAREQMKAEAPAEREEMAASAVMDDEVRVVSEATSSKPGSLFGGSSASFTPTATFGLLPPGGWRMPALAPDAPAALAGGYDLAFPALRPERLPASGELRKVPLRIDHWPVSVERRLFPALGEEAYLVAEVKNPSREPLPGGPAVLFVGADPSGEARLGFMPPGEAMTVPLGIDRAITPQRRVDVSQEKKGLLGGDELTRYVVTTEVANPHKEPVQLRIADQWPLSRDEKVEVKLEGSTPLAVQDQERGVLTWALTLPPGQKAQVSFTYSIRRAKELRLRP